MLVKRREFVGATLKAGLLGCLPSWALRQPDADKLQRLACNSWPFRAYFDTPQMPGFRDPKLPLLTQPDFPEFLADQFHIHNVEFLPPHFVDTEPSTIETVKAGLKKARSRCCNVMGVQIPGGVFTKNADPQAVARQADRWVGVAVALGSPSITIPLTGEGTPDAHTAAENLRPVVEIAHRTGIRVLFHNDDPRHESAEILVSVVKQLGRDRTGTCPDFGNFAPKSAAFALSQLQMLAPYASNICHAKDGIAVKNQFYADDFPASMNVMRDARFQGVYSLEFEGTGAPFEGVRKLMRMTEQHLA
jgi:sugar phosphate isomerase/epimerase